MSVGVYVHVPLCLRKCPYCDFYSVKYDVKTAEDYVQSVCRNLLKYNGMGIKADTLYFGGGTPSLLSAEQISRIVNTVNDCFDMIKPEITIEANPCTVDSDKLLGYRKAGVNRISFGVQSADDRQLEFLGRLHNFEQACIAVNNAVRVGFDNISCDLMLGLKGQMLDSLELSINRLASMPIDHISAYMLKIEPNTAFDCDVVRNSIADDDLQCDLYLKAVQLLEKHGFEQYEISNFAKAEKYSRHNLKYWQGEEYIGIGPSSHSFFDGKRYCVPKNIDEFVSLPIQSEVVLETDPDKLEEYIMLSLRTKWGISLKRLAELVGQTACDAVKDKAESLSLGGICKVENDRVSLTPQGYLVSNSVISEFIEACENS